MEDDAVNKANKVYKAIYKAVYEQAIAKQEREPEHLYKWQVIFGLIALNSGHYADLIHAWNSASKTNVSAIAFHARSILEIMLWSDYAAKSDENIRRIHCDSFNDLHDLFICFKESLKGGTDIFDPDLAIEELNVQKKKYGYSSFGPYLRVGQLSVNKELSEFYHANMKWLSKLAHPTGMSIIGFGDGEVGQKLKPVIVEHACKWFIRNVSVLLPIVDIELEYKSAD